MKITLKEIEVTDVREEEHFGWARDRVEGVHTHEEMDHVHGCEWLIKYAIDDWLDRGLPIGKVKRILDRRIESILDTPCTR
jgi:hypothetical protein